MPKRTKPPRRSTPSATALHQRMTVDEIARSAHLSVRLPPLPFLKSPAVFGRVRNQVDRAENPALLFHVTKNLNRGTLSVAEQNWLIQFTRARMQTFSRESREAAYARWRDAYTSSRNKVSLIHAVKRMKNFFQIN